MTRQQILTMIFSYTLVALALVAGVLFITEVYLPLPIMAFVALFLVVLILWINAGRILKAIYVFLYKDKIGQRKADPNNKLGRH